MIGSDAAIQSGGRGQTMGGWGAKPVTTTTSVRVINGVFDGMRSPYKRLLGRLDLRQVCVFSED